MAKIKVGVVDDHALFRQGISSLLNSTPELEVVLEASNGAHLLEVLAMQKKNLPQVMLMDIQMPEMNGLEATRILAAKYPKIKVVGLTMHDNDQLIYQLLENGACGFLPKNADVDIVIEAIKTVHVRGYYMDERISGILMKGTAQSLKTGGVLNSKEIEILKLICCEYSVREIGERMKLSHRTIEAHKTRIQEKIGAKNVVGMVLYAMNNHLLPFPVNVKETKSMGNKSGTTSQ